jgi:hypothetical protein
MLKSFSFFVSWVFAPAPGSAARISVANLKCTTPNVEPQGVPPGLELSRTLAAPRLRQSLAALGSGSGLNE